MKAKHWAVVGIIIAVIGGLIAALIRFVDRPVVLQPSGNIGLAQRDIFMLALVIMLLVIIPVFVMLAYIAWRYRASNHRAAYHPNWSNNNWLELAWWGIPILIVIALSVVAWQTSHELDPFREFTTKHKSLKVQVVALRWKWLFIYPEYRTASVGELVIPAHTTVDFSIAADAPMNSFWIPELGGQIYAMNGMKTKLYLVANRTGEFNGVSSNISGEGFADMKFTVRAVETDKFDAIIKSKSDTKPTLDLAAYDALAQPGILTEPQWYIVKDTTLFQSVIDKYMLPHSANEGYAETMHQGGDH